MSVLRQAGATGVLPEQLRLVAWWLAWTAAGVAGPAEIIPAAASGPALEEWQAALALGEAGREVPPAPAPGRQFFVSPDGSDRNPGSESQPLATLAGARDAVRAFRAAHGWPAGGVAVVLKPGTYPQAHTLQLTVADSGAPGAPVVYRAQMRGTATLTGGVRLGGFRRVDDPAVLRRLPAEARGRVWQTNLRAQGVSDYGRLTVRGFAQPLASPTLEVFCDGAAMRPARWPNDGMITASRLVDPGSKARGTPTILGCDSERLLRWGEAPDAWLFGYFRFHWADASVPVGRIDAAARTIATAEAYDYPGAGGADAKEGIRFYVYNLLEEIDEPGEWYLDRAAGVLYFYPPRDPDQCAIELSVLAQPLVAGEGVAWLRIEGLVFDLGRDNGLELRHAEHCLLAGCTIRRFAGNGLSILGGRDDQVRSCDVYSLGRRGIELVGGDRASLTPGGHSVENCDLHDFGRLDHTYVPGIEMDGVGHRAVHNRIHNCPSSAIRLEGNDHLIEANEVDNAVLESEDQGAMELFGNPTYRGVVFRRNLFRDIGPAEGGERAFAGRAALRFDDVIGGMLVSGNIFCRASSGGFGAIQVNSGRDNVIDHNLFIACAEAVTGGWEAGNPFWVNLRAGHPAPDVFLTDLYLRRYPSLAHQLAMPAMNFVSRNTAWRCGEAWEPGEAGFRPVPGPPAAYRRPDRWVLWQNRTLPDADALAIDAGKRGAPVRIDPVRLQELGFPGSALADVGLYVDAWRPALP